MKRRLSGSDSIPKGGANDKPLNLLDFYQMIKLKMFEQCLKCKTRRCPRFQPHADALDDWHHEVLNYNCQYCKCHCSYHFYDWFKAVSKHMYKQTPELYDNLSAPLEGANKQPWDSVARAFLNLDEDNDDGVLNNNSINSEPISVASSNSNSSKISRSNSFNNSPSLNNNNSPPMNGFGFGSPVPNGHYNNNNTTSTPPTMYSMSSPFSAKPSRQISQPNNSPTKFHVISDDESSDSELIPVQGPSAPINFPNFNAQMMPMMNGSFMAPQLASSPPNHTNSTANGLSNSASVTPTSKKNSEAENKTSEPPLKKQKTKEKSTREISYWASKSVPKEKEAVLKNVSTDAQFKLVRDITKSKISWADVDSKLVKTYEQKVKEKEEKLLEVTSGSRWFWIKECKLYFMRNKDGELVGWVELTSPQPKIENRFLREYGSEDFLMVKINKAFPDLARKGDYDRRTGIVRNFFDKGIWIGTVHYQFCFASATHIRSEKVFFHTNPKKLIAKLGDFSEIRNPTKYLARLGQPWSSTKATIELPLDKVEIAPDAISESGKEFTDGCGEMAPDIITSIYATPAFAHVDKSKPLPSAIQIRWGPCKGVLMVNPELPPGHVRFRKSMQKYKIDNPTLYQRQIEVCQESKRYSSRLNKEFIPLLHALGVPDSVFTNLVQKQLDKIKKLGDNPDYIKISLDDSRSYFMTKLKLFLTSNFSTQDPYYAGLIWKDKQKMLKELKGLRLEVERSCRLLGVWDQSGKLKANQCYVTYRLSNDSVQLKGKVVVMKNPTVHLGDVRVLEAVDCPDLNHLENVIVFPVTGKRPIADTIGGGDLDGDMFWVTACPDIVDNVKEEPPADYPRPKQFAVRPGEDMLERAKDAYIIQVFEGASLGKISNTYYTLADHFEDGPRNNYCLELSRLHSLKVDSAKTGDIVRLTKELNDLSKQIGSAKFLEQSFGKVVDTKGIVGKLYNMISDAIKDIKEPKYDYAYLDSDLLVEGREKYTKEAKELLKQYNERVCEIMAKNKFEDDEDRKRIHFDMLEEDFKQLFWEELGNSHDEAYKKASAWYEVCYKDKKSKQRSFPWVNIDVLTRIKNDRMTMGQKSRKRMAMSIPK